MQFFRGGRTAGAIVGKAADRILGPRPERLAPRDADFIYYEHPGRKSHLVAVHLFDSTGRPEAEIDLAGAIDWVRARLGLAPFFTHRIRREILDLDFPYWVPTQVDLREHIEVHKMSSRGWPPVGDLLSRVVAQPMDLSKPPWEIHIVTGITGVHDMPEHMVAVFLKVHHSAADGLALRQLTLDLYSDDVRAGGLDRDRRTPRRNAAVVRAIASLPGQALRFGRGILATNAAGRRLLAEEERGILPPEKTYPATNLNGSAGGRIGIDFVALPLDDIASIRAAVPGSTVNDVLLATVSGALRTFMGRADGIVEAPVVAKVPRSVRTSENWRSANQLVVISVPLHTDLDEPLDRLARISESGSAAKMRSGHPAVREQAGRVETSPAALLALSGRLARTQDRLGHDTQRKNHTMVSNIPLDVDGRVFCGASGVGVLANQPPIDGDLLRHFLCWGNGADLILNVCAAESAVPDLDAYLGELSQSFADLRKASHAQSE